MTTTMMSPEPATAAPLAQTAGGPPTGAALRAVVLKEMRQNLVLVALSLFIVVIVAFCSEFSSNGFLAYRYYKLNVLLFDAVRVAIPVTCAMVAFVLGVAQPLWDTNFDRWAFLIHRPVSRTLLFWGRVIAGLLLYFLVMGLPLIGLLFFSMTSDGGNYFVWQYTLPPIADFFTGIVYYFAGMLIADRQAMFYGSRIVPIILAITASICAILLPLFWLAILSSLLIAGLLAMAAMGSAVSHGYALRAPTALRFALATVMFISFSILCGVPSVGAGLRLHSSLNPELQRGDWWQYRSNTAYQLMEDGTFVKTSRVAQPPYDSSHSVDTSTDMEGNVIPLPSDQVFEAATSIRRLGPNESFQRRGYRDIDSLVSETTFSQGPRFPGDPVRPPEDHWYFDRTRNRFYLYKYPPEPFQYAGSLGANGFVAPPGEAQAFEAPLSETNGFVTPHALYRVDLERSALKTIFTPPAGELIRGSRYVNRTADPTHPSDRIYVLTDKHLFYMSTNGEVLVELPITRNFDYYFYVRYLPKKHWWVLEYHTAHFVMPTTKTDVHYEFYDDQGKLVSARDLQNEYEGILVQMAPMNASESMALNVQAGFVWAMSPLAQMLALPARSERVMVGSEVMIDAATVRAGVYDFQTLKWAAFGVSLVVLLGIAKILIWFYRLERGIAWYALTLLMGPAALLTLVATQRLPGKVQCPTCHTPRPVTAPTCPICHAPWPTPVQTGTEIIT